MKKIYPLILFFFVCVGAFATGHTVTPTLVNHVTCPAGTDGKAYVTVSGGVGPLIYNWNSVPTQSTDTLFNVAAGTYTCTVTDQNDMSITTATITINNGTAVSAVAQQSTLCEYQTLQLFGNGNPPYTWAGPNAFTSNLQNPIINNVQMQMAGTYTFTATSSSGCVGSTTVAVNVSPMIYVNAYQINPASCFGSCDASAQADVFGGSGGYNISWSNGAIGNFVNGLCAGTYSVFVTDMFGCQNFGNVNINQPAPLIIAPNATQPSSCGTCDGTIQAIITGGTSPYVYNWSNGATTSTISNLCPGTYTCNVIDASGCVNGASTTLNSQGNLFVNPLVMPDSCGQSVGSATAVISGAIGPVSYNWQPGNFTTQSIYNVGAGNYLLTVHDSLCAFSINVAITNYGPVINASSSNANCNNPTGMLVLNASGGTPPYNYSINGSAFSTNQTYTNMAAGTYTIICVDANGCQTQTTHTILNTSFNLVFSPSGATCNSNNGTAFVSASGGTPGYSFLWNTLETTQFIDSLLPGTYTCTVTDGAGCVATGVTTVNSAASVYLGYDYDYSNCGSNSLTANAFFGTPPYTYLWAPGGEVTPTISNQAPGSYTCTVTDNNGCSGIGYYDIYNSNYSLVTGRIYADLNNNCTYETNENSSIYLYVLASSASNPQAGYGYSYLQNGYFQLYLPSTPDTYTLTLLNPYSYNYNNFTFSCSNNVITFNSNCDTILNLDLGYNPVVGQDLHVQGYCGVARPGFSRAYNIYYGNPGTDPVNATVKMHVDDLLTFTGSTPPPTTINGNDLEWNVGILNHGDYSAIYVNAMVPTIQNGGALGTPLHDSVWIEPISGDNYVTDNSYACTSSIVGSYDPNMKEVFAENMDQAGAIDTSATELFYTVHFQNTGTDTAFTITVRDTISALLDLTTLEILGASHNFTASILPNRVLEVKFDNILLVDSNNNEALSHGYFHYKIRTDGGLNVGDQINNTAAIYFDFNLPVITNTVETPVVLSTVGIKEKSKLAASVFPNPSSGNRFNIRINDVSFKGLQFCLYNVSGAKVLDQHLTAQPTHEISTSGLTNGIYFYQLINDQGKKLSGKIVIQN